MKKADLLNGLMWLLIVTAMAAAISCNQRKELKVRDDIRITQLGYHPDSVKQFVLADRNGTSFEIVAENGVVVFKGKLQDLGIWVASGETVLLGDFSELTEEGEYRVLVDNSLLSYPFEIKKNLYTNPLNAAIKSYYFQRASMPIEKKIWRALSQGSRTSG